MCHTQDDIVPTPRRPSFGSGPGIVHLGLAITRMVGTGPAWRLDRAYRSRQPPGRRPSPRFMSRLMEDDNVTSQSPHPDARLLTGFPFITRGTSATLRWNCPKLWIDSPYPSIVYMEPFPSSDHRVLIEVFATIPRSTIGAAQPGFTP